MPITFASEHDSCMYSVGDRVIITLEIGAFKELQAEHGGWSDDMMQVCVQAKFLRNETQISPNKLFAFILNYIPGFFSDLQYGWHN